MGASLGKESLHSLVCGGGYHCVMIGLDGSGKTTILYRLKYGQYINTSPTIGFNCEKVKTSFGKVFNIWDVGGQDKTRPLWRSYTRCTDAIIFVVDSSDSDRLEEAKLVVKNCQTDGEIFGAHPGAGKHAGLALGPGAGYTREDAWVERSGQACGLGC